jgi:hypothetical protein
MKPIFFSIIMGLGLMAGLETARAQDGDVPTPAPPFLAPVPDYGHWMVTFKNKEAAPAASPATPLVPAAAPSKPGTPPAPVSSPAPDDASLKSIETIKTGDLRGVTLTFADGKSKQYTCQGDWVLCSSPKGPQLSIANPASGPYIYYTTGFILLDGMTINMSTFKETEKHNGVLAFHYKSGDADVWIDTSTMLPVGAKQNGVEVSYQFLTPPPRPFPIPKDQADLLQKEQEAYKSSKSLR